MKMPYLIREIWQNEGRPKAMSILDLWRIVLHFPVGCFAFWLIMQYTFVGLVFSFGFLVYEVAEDWRIGDRGYKDIAGYLLGIAVTALIWGVLKGG